MGTLNQSRTLLRARTLPTRHRAHQSRDRKGALPKPLRPPFRSLAIAALLAAAASAAIIDRVAVVVGNTVITEREVQREVRLTDFMNSQPLDLGPAALKAAANRLVDQQLIRNEMKDGAYAMPTEADAANMLRNFRQQHFASPAQYQATLEKYGITEPELKEHLLWELAAIRFTDARFQAGPEPAPGPVQSANRMNAGASPAPGESTVDQQLDAWLKDQRSNTKVVFKPGAFQ
jgi:hypothetical protein